MTGPTEHGHQGGHAHGPARPLDRLRALLLPERRDVLVVVLFAVAAATLSLASPIAVESLVNTVAFGVLMWPVVVISLALLFCLALAAAIRAMKIFVIECLQRRLFVRVVADYSRRLPRARLDSFDHEYGPELTNRFFDILNLQKSLATLLLDGVSVIVTAVVGMIVLAFYHPFLLGFDVVLLLMMAFLLLVLGRGGVRTSLVESHTKYDVAGWLEEIVRSPRTLKFGEGEHLALRKADELAGRYVEARKNHFRVVWRQTLFALGLQVIASTALLGLGGWLVINRQLTLGQLVAAELIVSLVVASAAKLGKYAETYYDLLAGAEKLGVVTDLPLERENGESLARTNAGMSVRGIDIREIDGRATLFQGEWLAMPNERVALAGRAGSGRSSLLEALCGLREAGPGCLELDGIDVRSLCPARLREQVALVGEGDLIIGTIEENIRLGRSHLTPVEIRRAIDDVGLRETIRLLPGELQTRLNDRGGPLSSSQIIRLLIARAVAGRPRLLLVDGLLDLLDPRDRQPLLALLFDRTAPWTLLLVTHDPDLIAQCDRKLDSPERGAP